MSDLDEANKVGNLFNSWGKIIFAVVILIVSCATAYFKIFGNEADIAQEKKERIEAIALVEERGEKRYSRAMELAGKLESLGMKLEERVRKLEIDNAYLKGKYESNQ